jgi:hypothetical protein
MNTDDAYIYERVRHLANVAVWSIDLQVRRIKESDTADGQFIFRRWMDYHFLIVALSRLLLTTKQLLVITELKPQIEPSIQKFEAAFPWLRDLRNVVAHFDEYPIGKGKNKKMMREGTEVAIMSEEQLSWLGFEIRPQDALIESASLFKAVQSCCDAFGTGSKNNQGEQAASSNH